MEGKVFEDVKLEDDMIAMGLSTKKETLTEKFFRNSFLKIFQNNLKKVNDISVH